MRKYMVVNKMSFIALLLAVFLAGCGSNDGRDIAGGASGGSPSPVSLGSADSFAVLAGSTITNTGTTTIRDFQMAPFGGNLGVYPGTSCTGLPTPCTGVSPGTEVIGTIHLHDTAAASAQTDLTAAYADAKLRSGATLIAGPGELGGLTLPPGVYKSAGTMNLPDGAVLTLDAKGDMNSRWIFQIGSTLTIGNDSQIKLINQSFNPFNGGQTQNIFWQVGGSASLGMNSDFAGNILALDSITLATGATLYGRALARNGSVSLDTNTVTRP